MKLQSVRFFAQHFLPSLRGVIRTGYWRFAWERGRYMLTRRIQPFSVDGFRVEHGGHMVGLWYFAVEAGLFKEWPQLLPEAPVIVDIGANCGVFGWCCRKRWPKATIIAIEPHPKLAAECRARRCGDLPVYDQVHNVGLADVASSHTLYVTIEGGFTASMRPGYYGNAKTEELEIQCVPGDSLDLPAADLVKIDVDGAEEDVVRGGGDFIRRAKYLVIEIDQRANLRPVQQLVGRSDCRRITENDFLFYPNPGPTAESRASAKAS